MADGCTTEGTSGAVSRPQLVPLPCRESQGSPREAKVFLVFPQGVRQAGGGPEGGPVCGAGHGLARAGGGGGGAGSPARQPSGESLPEARR